MYEEKDCITVEHFRMIDKDYLVETEDVLTDCIHESLKGGYYDYQDINIDYFIQEFKSRSKKVRLQALIDLIGAETREEFEETLYELNKLGEK